MKRRLIICSSLITIILSCFSFPIFAEETVQDSSNLHTLSDGVLLDQYFYDNYDLLPYLEFEGSQYINTGIKQSSHLRLSITASDFSLNNRCLIGSRDGYNVNNCFIYYTLSDSSVQFWFASGQYQYRTNFYPYVLFTFTLDENKTYVNNSVVHEFNQNDFDGTTDIYVGTLGSAGNPVDYMNAVCKVYKASIYDYEVNNGDGAYLRYYYPAKAKTSGAIGLYDAVSNTFIVSGSNVQFSNPTNEYVETFQISSFLTSSLTWIGQIFDAIIQMPIIIVFMAIGLAGAMFRWGRRIVHF